MTFQADQSREDLGSEDLSSEDLGSEDLRSEDAGAQGQSIETQMLPVLQAVDFLLLQEGDVSEKEASLREELGEEDVRLAWLIAKNRSLALTLGRMLVAGGETLSDDALDKEIDEEF